jgi:hypothetical protein
MFAVNKKDYIMKTFFSMCFKSLVCLFAILLGSAIIVAEGWFFIWLGSKIGALGSILIFLVVTFIVIAGLAAAVVGTEPEGNKNV